MSIDLKYCSLLNTDETLKQRGDVHGDFTQNSELMDELMVVMTKRAAWRVSLTPFQRVALTYIIGKVSRIICGNPNFADHWHDIQGYAKCVEDRLPPAEPSKAKCPNCYELIPVTTPRGLCPHCQHDLMKRL